MKPLAYYMTKWRLNHRVVEASPWKDFWELWWVAVLVMLLYVDAVLLFSL